MLCVHKTIRYSHTLKEGWGAQLHEYRSVIAGDVIYYVASKDGYSTRLSLCQWRQSFLSNTELVVRYVSFLCVTNAILDHFRTGFFAH